MSDLDDVTAALASSLTKPLKAAGDMGSFEMRSSADMMAVHRYLLSLAAAKTKSRGIRNTRIIPGDAAGQTHTGNALNPWGNRY